MTKFKKPFNIGDITKYHNYPCKVLGFDRKSVHIRILRKGDHQYFGGLKEVRVNKNLLTRMHREKRIRTLRRELNV